MDAIQIEKGRTLADQMTRSADPWVRAIGTFALTLLDERDIHQKDHENAVARLMAENAWFREAQGVRDAEDQRAIDTLKAEAARLTAVLDEYKRVMRLAEDNQIRAYRLKDAAEARVERLEADIDDAREYACFTKQASVRFMVETLTKRWSEQQAKAMQQRDRVERLEAALRTLIRLSRHANSCPQGRGVGYYKPTADAVCDCGYDAALAAGGTDAD